MQRVREGTYLAHVDERFLQPSFNYKRRFTTTKLMLECHQRTFELLHDF